MYRLDSSNPAGVAAYSGNDTFVSTDYSAGIIGYEFKVYIMPTADVDGDELYSLPYIGWDSVTFENGNAIKNASEGIYKD